MLRHLHLFLQNSTYQLGNSADYLTSSADYDKIPYIKKATEILNELYNLSNDDLFSDLISYLPVYRQRTENRSFLKLLDELSQERWQEWIKTQSPLQQKWNKRWKDFKFAQRVSYFIHAQKKKEIPQHLLLKRFNNKRVSDFERIRNLLEQDGIFFHKEKYRGKETGRYLKK